MMCSQHGCIKPKRLPIGSFFGLGFSLCYLIVVIIVVFPTFFYSFRDIVAEAVFESVWIILMDAYSKILLVLLLDSFCRRVVRVDLISTIVSVIKACFSLTDRSEQIDFIKGFFIKFSRGFLIFGIFEF